MICESKENVGAIMTSVSLDEVRVLEIFFFSSFGGWGEGRRLCRSPLEKHRERGRSEKSCTPRPEGEA